MWTNCLIAVILITLVGGVISILMMLWSHLKERREEKVIRQLFDGVGEDYLPAAKDYIVDTMVDLTGAIIEKVPDWTGKIKESIEKIEQMD